MKQAINRLRQGSNYAICNGETILAQALNAVADALEYQVEYDICKNGIPISTEVLKRAAVEFEERRREANAFGESVSRSARGLEAIDPGGPPPKGSAAPRRISPLDLRIGENFKVGSGVYTVKRATDLRDDFGVVQVNAFIYATSIPIQLELPPETQVEEVV